MSGCVFMMPGQGSQYPGMGLELLDVPEVRRVFECASDVFGINVRDVCLDADGDLLGNPRNAQIAISALSLAVARALEARGVRPRVVIGFSLGQISALAVSGMLSDEQAFRLVGVRTDALCRAASETQGAMTALLRADEAAAQALCAACAWDEVLVPANFNCPGQVVVSGSASAVGRVEEEWKLQGGRSVRLATAGAFHSPLMKKASCELADYLECVDFAEPEIPILCNVDALPLSAATVREHLVRQVVEPVRFEQSVRNLVGQGFRSFVEAGYGGVLRGFVRRIDATLEGACVQDLASLRAVAAR